MDLFIFLEGLCEILNVLKNVLYVVILVSGRLIVLLVFMLCGVFVIIVFDINWYVVFDFCLFGDLV